MNRAQALREGQQIGASLLARVEPPLAGVPIPSPQLPAFALPPREAGERVCRAMTLVVPAGVDVFALLAVDWEQSGLQPQSWSTPEGSVLVGVTSAGFVLVLRDHAGRAELYVVSPILQTSNAGLYGGIAVGAAIGLVGPCFSMAMFQGLAGEHAFLGFVPLVLLLGGALLLGPDTRQFGVGLLIGGAITGIVTAGVCASILP